MTSPRNSGKAPEFWHCARCGTPNPSASYITTCVACGAARKARQPSNPAPAPTGRPWWRPKPLDRRAKWLLGVSLAYFAVTLALYAIMRLFAESWLPATLVLFSPRWLLLLPLPLLAGLALCIKRPALLLVDGLLLAFIAGPFMGLSLPLPSLVRSSPIGTKVRVMTLNQSEHPLDHAAFRRLIRSRSIDVICFQEGRDQTALSGADAEGWHFDSSGLIATRFPIVEEFEPENPNAYQERLFWPLRIKRIKVRLPDTRECLIVCVHMPTMRTGFTFLKKGETDAAYRYQDWRWKQMNDLIGRLSAARDVPSLICGDFNMPIDSPMMGSLRRQYRDAFRESGWGYGYTRPARWPFIGIDHILVSPEWDVRHCWVGPDVGSDHLPVLAELILPATVSPSE